MFAEPILPFFLLHPGRITAEAGLRVRDRDGFQASLNANTERDVLVAILPLSGPVSYQCRKYYFAAVVPIIATEYVGTGDYEWTHNELAHKFLGLPPDPATGERRRRSTANDAMSDAEFRWYLQQVIEWATDPQPNGCGLIIPAPESIGYRYEVSHAA